MDIKTDKIVNIFFVYAREDEMYRDEMERHLTLLKRTNEVDIWHDGKIIPGTQWEEAIKARIYGADIIMLFISKNFIASDYCIENELEIALKRHNEKSAVVMPILIMPCLWNDTKFAHLQILPRNSEPIITWKNSDSAYVEIASEIKRVSLNIRKRREEKIWRIEELDQIISIKEKKLEEIIYEENYIESLVSGIREKSERVKVLEGRNSRISEKRQELIKLNIELKEKLKEKEKEISIAKAELSQKEKEYEKKEKYFWIILVSLAVFIILIAIVNNSVSNKRKRVLNLQEEIQKVIEKKSKLITPNSCKYFNYDPNNDEIIGEYSNKFYYNEFLSLGLEFTYTSFLRLSKEDSLFFLVINNDNDTLIDKKLNSYSQFEEFTICDNYCKDTLRFQIEGEFDKGNHFVEIYYKGVRIDRTKIKIRE